MSRKQRDRFHRVLRIFFDQQRDPDPNRRYVTAPQLAKMFGCTDRSIYRLMDSLRDDHRLPIAPIPEHGGYGFYETVTTLPTLVYSRMEALTLCIFLCSMSMFEDTIFGDPSRSLVEKLTAGLCEDLALEFEAVTRSISFRCTGAERHIDPATFTTLLPALAHHQELEIEYAKGPSLPSLSSSSSSSSSSPPTIADADAVPRDGHRDSAPGLRRIEPLHLALIDYGWYLFAWDPAAGDIRNFALRRIRSIRPTGITCDPRPFDIEQELDYSFGAFRSGKSSKVVRETVHLRFSGRAASIVPEFRWHHSQQFTSVPADQQRPDSPDAIDMTMHVAINPKLIGWIMQWLGEVAILEPKSLRDDIRTRAVNGLACLDGIPPA